MSEMHCFSSLQEKNDLAHVGRDILYNISLEKQNYSPVFLALKGVVKYAYALQC